MASTSKLIEITLRLNDKMSGNLDKASNSLKQMGSTLTSIGAGMTAAFTVPIVAAGTAAVNMSLDFDRGLKNIQSISHQTDAEIAALGQTFLDMSTNMDITLDSAQNLNEAFYQIQSSGFAGNDAMLILNASTKAASAGLTETAVAAEATVAVLNAYGLSAEHAAEINDIMFETVNRGVVTYEQLAGSIGTVVGLAAQLGVDFAEIGAAMATMTKQGIDSDSAMTNLNGIFTAMLRPTTEMTTAIRALGYESGSAMLSTLGLGGTMQALAEYTGGSQEAMAALFGDVRALRGAMALTGSGAQIFVEDLAAIADSAGATQEAFEIISQSWAASFQHFQNVAGVALMEAGNLILPILTQLLNAVSELLVWWIKLDDTTQGFVIALLAIVAAIGPILLIFGQIVGLMAALSTISAAAGAGIAAVAAPLLMISGIIVGVIALIVLLIANWEALGATLSQIGTMVMEGWRGMLDAAGTALSQLAQIVVTTLGRLGEIGLEIGRQIINGLIKGISQAILDLIKFVTDKANEISQAIRNAFGIRSPSKVMEKMGNQVVEGFNKGIETMGGIGVSVPQASGGTSGQPALGFAGAGASGVGNVTNYNTFNVPMGTPDSQVRWMADELAKLAKRRGAQGTK